MWRYPVILLLACCISLTIDAQTTYKLSIKIIDNRSAPLQDASIIVLNSAQGSFSAANGEASIPGIAAGNYTIQVSHVGYATVEQRVTVPNESTVVIRMSDASTQLGEV